MEFIPGAGACLATRNVIEEKGLVRWMVRGESKAPADNGWQIMSHTETVDGGVPGDLTPQVSDIQIDYVAHYTRS